MISYEQAIEIILREAAAELLPTERIEVSRIGGRVCAQDIVSALNIPSFDNAAMDGFALQYDDTKKNLKVVSRILAGDTPGDLRILPGTCCEIMTGAPVPQGVDCIIPVEQSNRQGDIVSFSGDAVLGSHIRKIGSDFSAGQMIVEMGTKLGIQHALPLAALGVGSVDVYCKPKVAFIPTGKEITDRLDQPLTDGKIYNSSLPYALAFLSNAGAQVFPQDIIADDPSLFQVAIKRLMNEDINLIISSGAVSAGSHDFIRSSLEEIGAVILFHKVAIKPGKPVLFARLPNGALYLGLPGNPVSTAAGLRFFAHPLLSALLRQTPEQPVYARAKTQMSRKPGLRLFLKARIDTSQEGVLEAHILDGQESYKTAPFLSMNAWVVIPEYVQRIDINDIISVFPLHRFS